MVVDPLFVGESRFKNSGWATRHRLLCYRRGLTTYLEVFTYQTIPFAAAALVARRIVASAQLQLALGGGWNATQLPSN